MSNRRIKISTKTGRQRGFTLIDLLIGVLISGILAVGVSVSISQILTVNANSNSRMVAIKQVENAIDSIRQDVIMAQNITPDSSGETGFPLTLSWIEWTNNRQNVVKYNLTEDKQLKRQLTVTEGSNTTTTTTHIAAHIASLSMLDPETYSGGKITFSITATVGDFRSAAETRTFEVLPRPAN